MKEVSRKLFNAIWEDNLEAVKAAVEAGADVNEAYSFGGTPLGFSAYRDIAIMEYLIKAGALPNVQDNKGETALHQLKILGDFSPRVPKTECFCFPYYCHDFLEYHNNWYLDAYLKLTLLLENKADMYIKDNTGQTPFALYMKSYNFLLSDMLVLSGYMPKSEDFAALSKKLKKEYYYKLLNKYTSMSLLEGDLKSTLLTRKKNDLKFLAAVRTGSLNDAKELFKNGVDLNVGSNAWYYSYIENQSFYENPSLAIRAAFLNHDLEMLKFLFSVGADPNMRGSSFVLRLSLLNGFFEEAKLLIDFGVDIRKDEDENVYRSLLCVSSEEKQDMLEYLISRGYTPSEETFKKIKDPDYRDYAKAKVQKIQRKIQGEVKETADNINKNLLKAVKKGDLQAAREAVKAGADVNYIDEHGWTPLFYVFEDFYSTQMRDFLLEQGADVNIKSRHGRTVLHVARHFMDLQKLLAYNADMYIKDNNGRTPFMVNIERINDDIFAGRVLLLYFVLKGYVPTDIELNALTNVNDRENVKKMCEEILALSDKEKEEILFKIEQNEKFYEACSGMNPYFAKEEESFCKVKEAIEAGANVNFVRGCMGEITPLAIALEAPIYFIRYLLENGINPNMIAREYSKETVLHIASRMQDIKNREGLTEKVRLLLKYGADMTSKDACGKTPFASALSLSITHDIAQVFVDSGYIPQEEDFEDLSISDREYLKEKFMPKGK